MNKKFCPDCRARISGKSCDCGWQSKQEKTIDRQCVYQSEGKRCPLTGTISDVIPATAPRFCIHHWETRGDCALAEKILKEIYENPSKYLSQKSWREVLLEKKMKELEETNKNITSVSELLQVIKKMLGKGKEL